MDPLNYDSVARTDPLCTAAAFGLARAHLLEGDRLRTYAQYYALESQIRAFETGGQHDAAVALALIAVLALDQLRTRGHQLLVIKVAQLALGP